MFYPLCHATNQYTFRLVMPSVKCKQPAAADSCADVAVTEEGDSVLTVTAAWFIVRLVLWYLASHRVQFTIISSIILGPSQSPSALTLFAE